MSNAPDRIYVCTKRAVASNFRDGIIFGSPEPSEALGTVEYVRADLVEKLKKSTTKRNGNSND